MIVCTEFPIKNFFQEDLYNIIIMFPHKRLHFTLLLGLISVTASSQPAKYSNEFLNVGVGARSIGMGKASVASATDVTAAYWNPGGLVRLAGVHQGGLMHAQYFAGIAKFDYIGAASKLDGSSALGVSLLRYGVDDIPNTIDLIDGDGNIDYDRIRSFSVADYALLVTYSRSSPVEGLDLGGNVKVIRRMVGEFASSWGFGIDIAARFMHEQWMFGAVMRDAASTFNVWQFNEKKLSIGIADSVFNLPSGNSMELTLPRLYIGVARNFLITEKSSVLVELNASVSFEGRTAAVLSSRFIGTEPVLGFEFNFRDVVFFRTGVGNLQRINEFDGQTRVLADPSVGVGLQIGDFYLDYAMGNISPQTISLYSNIFSLKYVFGQDK
jgi:hypothetical protein